MDHAPPHTQDLEERLADVADREGLAELLRELHVRADSPSLRELEQRTTHQRPQLTRSTVSDMLAGRRFPRKAVLLAFLRECGLDGAQTMPWAQAWERIAATQKNRPAGAAELHHLRQQLADLKGEFDQAKHSWEQAFAEQREQLRVATDRFEQRIVHSEQRADRAEAVLERFAGLVPWMEFADRHDIGDFVEGEVLGLALPGGLFIGLAERVAGWIPPHQLAEEPVDDPTSVARIGDRLFVKIMSIGIGERRINLSLKEANAVELLDDDFEPTLYGMPIEYDANRQHFIYPEGMDPESGQWLPGHEQEAQLWEKEYAKAQARFEAHRRQIKKNRDKALPPATDEELEALRKKLAGEGN